MMKGNKGITLIALIITIIVMMILVAVTVTVALQGGLFGTAKKAGTDTQKAADEETLTSIVVGSYSKETLKVEESKLRDNLSFAEWEAAEELQQDDKGYYLECTSPKGNVFKVYLENGKILNSGMDEIERPNDFEGGIPPVSKEEEDLLRKYVLGEEGTSKTIDDIIDVSTYIFKEDASTIENADEVIKFSRTTDNGSFGPIPTEEYAYLTMRYKRNVYKIKYSFETRQNLEMTLEYTAEGNLGKYVQYKNNTWIVLRDDKDGVELLSANASKDNVVLGGSTVPKARDSYNTAVDTLVQKCKDMTGIEVGGEVLSIRNVGGPEKDTTTSKVIFANLSNFEPDEGVSMKDYEGDNGFKLGDENYVNDFTQMEKLGLLVTDNPANYWFATRYVSDFHNENISDSVNFQMHWVERDGEWRGRSLATVKGDGTAMYDAYAYAARPVVTLMPGILAGATEEGTIDDPIILK